MLHTTIVYIYYLQCAFEISTIFFQVLAAEIHYPGHLSVDGVKAELFVVVLLPVSSRLFWQRQLEGLQEPRLVIIKVSDAIHGHPALSSS